MSTQPPQGSDVEKSAENSSQPASKPRVTIAAGQSGSGDSSDSEQTNKATKPEAGTKEPSKSQFQKLKKRTETNLDLVPIESNFLQHKYVFRRPRALQARYHGRTIEGGDRGVDAELIAATDEELSHQSSRVDGLSREPSSNAPDSEKAQSRSSDNLTLQRERLDLFIDLLWAGIISNISENYFEQAFSGERSSGHCLLEFFLLFLPAWSMWSELQVFLNSYYMDDLIQRIVVVWVLILGLLWGNNAPFILNQEDGYVSWFISVYLIATATLRFVELFYSIWIPWLRRIWIWRFLLTLPITGLWIGAIFSRDNSQLGLIFASLFFERAWIWLEASPVGDRLWGGEHHVRKYHDYKHTIKRLENFFIITLGEGVFLLIRGSPLGKGFSQSAGRGISALMIYYLIHWTYFYGDHTRTLVHPVYRRWNYRISWLFLHIPLFMSTVLLSSSVLYLIDYTPEGETNGTAAGGPVKMRRAEEGNHCATKGESGGVERRATEEICTDHRTLQIAYVTAFCSLGVIFAMQTALSLLNKPLDPPKTLILSNRYLRLIPRMAAIIAFETMWLYDWHDPGAILGFMSLICWIVFLWESRVGMERGGGWFEPKHTSDADPLESSE